MVMDPRFTDSTNSIDSFKFDENAFPPAFYDLASTFIFKDAPGDLTFMDLPILPHDPNPGFVASISSGSSEVDSLNDSGSSDNGLKLINTILMEENMEQTPGMFYDPLALQAIEKSLYDVIEEKYPVSPSQPPLYFNQNFENPDEYFFASSSGHGSNSNCNGTFSVDYQCIVDPGQYTPPVQGYSFAFGTSFGSMENSNHNGSGPMSSSMSSHLVPNILSSSQSILQFNRGLEEASKSLPNNNQFVIDFECYVLPPESKGSALEVAVNVEDTRESSPNGLGGRKNHRSEDSNNAEEGRTSRFLAVYGEESELSEMFDKVLLFDQDVLATRGNGGEATNVAQLNGQPHGSKGGQTRGRKRRKKNKVVDIRMLLINCAQSVVADDRRTANVLLKQIRQHSSPIGDASQRLANIFVNGLEARMAGTRSQIYAALSPKRTSAAEKLKVHELYLSRSPFCKLARIFANKTIFDLAMNSREKKLHIIDFGILHGFQWPIVIQHLSTIPGGPLELRITGIDLPQPDFHPSEMVEETGHRLAKYCERFSVQFQYHAIAQRWETIKIEDLNIFNDEVLLVNSMLRLNPVDDRLTEHSPADIVLALIRRMNPDIFIQSIVNGTFNSPFFLTRFREALFFYSSLFDMLDTTTPRENKERIYFEQEFCRRDIISIVACEGGERMERPLTYKQWHVRNMRVGLRILPLPQELMKNFRHMVKSTYHKDFVIEEDGQWMLQGWKGRIFCASSCWIPAANV